jgi:hypothetical protein
VAWAHCNGGGAEDVIPGIAKTRFCSYPTEDNLSYLVPRYKQTKEAVQLNPFTETMSFWTEGGLTQLAQQGDLEGVRQLIERGVLVDFIENGRYNDTPLMVAAREGHVTVMQYLLDQGANVNYYDNDLFSPVTAAGGAEQWLALKLLAERGGDFEHHDATGRCGCDYLARCRSKVMRAAIEAVLKQREAAL